MTGPGRQVRQRVDVDDVSARKHHRALHDVLKLAHVARPLVGEQAPHRLGGDVRDLLAGLTREAPQECLHQLGDVVRALAQRRQRDREHVQSVIEVLAELPARHHLGQVAVGGRHHPHVDADRLVAAHPFELTLLQHTQQLHLCLQGQLADLVQEQRAAVGQLEAALVLANRARERALLVPEQLAFDEAGRDGRAVDLHQQPLAPRAGLVDRPRDQLLAGSGLARDEDGGVGRRDHGDALHGVAQARRAAHDLAAFVEAADLSAKVLAIAGELLLVAPPVRDVLDEQGRAGGRGVEAHFVEPPAILTFDGQRSLLGQRLLKRAVHRRVAEARGIPGALSDHLLARLPTDRQGAIVGVREAPLAVEGDERVGDALQDGSDVGARGLCLLSGGLRLDARRLGARQQVLPLPLGLQAVGDVLEDAQQADPVGLARDRHGAHLDRTDLPVLVNEAVDRRGVLPVGLHRAVPVGDNARSILRVEGVDPSAARHLLRRQADDPLAGGVEVQAVAIAGRQEDAERRRVAHGAEALLHREEGVIDALSLHRARHALRDELQQIQIALLPGHTHARREAGDADQHAVDDDRHEQQRPIAVGRDQCLHP